MVTHFTGKKTEAHLPQTIQLVGSGAENNFLIQKRIWVDYGDQWQRDLSFVSYCKIQAM